MKLEEYKTLNLAIAAYNTARSAPSAFDWNWKRDAADREKFEALDEGLGRISGDRLTMQARERIIAIMKDDWATTLAKREADLRALGIDPATLL